MQRNWPLNRRFGATVLLLATSSLAHAQTTTTRGTANVERSIRLGPLVLTPRLVLESAGVDNNVYNSRRRTPDRSVLLRPALGASLPVGQHLRLTGNGSLGIHYFYTQVDERSLDRSASGRATLSIGPVSVFGGGGGGQSRSRASIEIDERLLRQNRSAEAGVSLRLGHRLSLNTSGRSRITRHEPGLSINGSNVSATLDNNSLTGSVGFEVSLTGKTGLTGEASVTENRFISDFGPGTRRARTYRYGGGFQFSDLAILNGRIRAGIRDIPGGGAVPPYRGLLLDVSVSTRILGDGRLSLGASRDVNFSIIPSTVTSISGSTRNSYVLTQYDASITKEFPFDLQGTLTGRFEQSSYVQPVAGSGGSGERVDHRWTGSVRLLRAFGKMLRLGWTVSVSRRTSSSSGQAYQSAIYGLTGELTP